jgi:sugar/nucleoside kinase (ribokinase family)
MQGAAAEVVVAGHVCLDIIPTFSPGSGEGNLFGPGKLSLVGPVVLSTGGAVSNTGLALDRLGVAARLAGKVGDDFFGRTVLDILRGYSPSLTEGMIVGKDEETSYTIVVSPPGVDRFFLHSPGANDTFSADDVADE